MEADTQPLVEVDRRIMSKAENFVCWVKLEGFPWYPARVVDREQYLKDNPLDEGYVLEQPTETNLLVEFFDMETLCQTVEEVNVCEFTSNMHLIHQHSEDPQDLQNACRKAQHYIREKGLKSQQEDLEKLRPLKDLFKKKLNSNELEPHGYFKPRQKKNKRKSASKPVAGKGEASNRPSSDQESDRISGRVSKGETDTYQIPKRPVKDESNESASRSNLPLPSAKTAEEHDLSDSSPREDGKRSQHTSHAGKSVSEVRGPLANDSRAGHEDERDEEDEDLPALKRHKPETSDSPTKQNANSDKDVDRTSVSDENQKMFDFDDDGSERNQDCSSNKRLPGTHLDSESEREESDDENRERLRAVEIQPADVEEFVEQGKSDVNELVGDADTDVKVERSAEYGPDTELRSFEKTAQTFTHCLYKYHDELCDAAWIKAQFEKKMEEVKSRKKELADAMVALENGNVTEELLSETDIIHKLASFASAFESSAPIFCANMKALAERWDGIAGGDVLASLDITANNSGEADEASDNSDLVMLSNDDVPEKASKTGSPLVASSCSSPENPIEKSNSAEEEDENRRADSVEKTPVKSDSPGSSSEKSKKKAKGLNFAFRSIKVDDSRSPSSAKVSPSTAGGKLAELQSDDVDKPASPMGTSGHDEKSNNDVEGGNPGSSDTAGGTLAKSKPMDIDGSNEHNTRAVELMDVDTQNERKKVRSSNPDLDVKAKHTPDASSKRQSEVKASRGSSEKRRSGSRFSSVTGKDLQAKSPTQAQSERKSSSQSEEKLVASTPPPTSKLDKPMASGESGNTLDGKPTTGEVVPMSASPVKNHKMRSAERAKSFKKDNLIKAGKVMLQRSCSALAGKHEEIDELIEVIADEIEKRSTDHGDYYKLSAETIKNLRSASDEMKEKVNKLRETRNAAHFFD